MLVVVQAFLGAVWTAIFAKTLFASIFTPRLPTQASLPSSPLVDVLVPVRNEANRHLDEFLKDLKAQDYPCLKVVVVDDRSTDRSADVIRGILDDPGPDMRLVSGEEVPDDWMGKTYALHQAKRVAHGKWLALIDADVRVGADAISRAVRTALQSNAQAVCLLPRFVYQSYWVGATLPVMIWLSIMRVSPTESNSLRTKAVFGFGNFILVNREAHDRIGGFDAYRSHVLDDCELFRLLKQAGEPTLVVDGAISVQSEMYTNLSELVQGFTKNSFAAIGYSWLLATTTLLFIATSILLLGSLSSDSLTSFFYVLPMMLTSLTMTWRLQAPPHAFFLFPISLLVCGWIIARSAISTGLRNGVDWKGRLVK